MKKKRLLYNVCSMAYVCKCKTNAKDCVCKYCSEYNDDNSECYLEKEVRCPLFNKKIVLVMVQFLC